MIEAGKTFKPLAENDLGERTLASYAVTDGTLFIRTESHFVRVGAGNAQALRKMTGRRTSAGRV